MQLLDVVHTAFCVRKRLLLGDLKNDRLRGDVITLKQTNNPPGDIFLQQRERH